MASRPRIGVVGATGAVGTITLELLRERGYDDVRLFASARSAGTELGGSVVEEATPEALAAGDLDLCLFSVGTSASRELVPHAVRGGAIAIDKSAAYRLEPGIPLVVPEVNGIRAGEHDGIVANPNCCAIPLTCTLKPLHDAAGLVRVRVATYQSVSGAGAQAMERLRGQSPDELDLRMDWSFDGVEFEEEEKLREETRKILELPALPVSATCVRVPVMVGHAEAVWIETREPLSAEEATSILAGAPGIALEQFPTPGGAAGGDDVLVGRIRKDPTVENGLALFIVGDNLRKGAALNAIQIAELLLAPTPRRGLILAAVTTALTLLAPAPTLVAAGDIASCRSTGDERTAAIVARTPGTVAVLGDIVYEAGSAAEFRDCYSWRRFRGRTRAALGNHEYGSAGRADLRRRTSGCPIAATTPTTLGAWHVVVLNSNCGPAGGCADGSPQQRWLAADLADNSGRLHARLLAPPALQLGPARLRRDDGRALADAGPRRRRRRARRPRPPLRALRAHRRHPLVRRRNGRAQLLPGPVAAPPERRRRTTRRSACSG